MSAVPYSNRHAATLTPSGLTVPCNVSLVVVTPSASPGVTSATTAAGARMSIRPRLLSETYTVSAGSCHTERPANRFFATVGDGE